MKKPMREIQLFDETQRWQSLIPPGEARLARALDTDICLVNYQGKLRAFANDCPHAGYPLHRGKVNGFGEIVCPQHGYMFSLLDGEEAGRNCRALRFYEVVERDGEVYLMV
jgi:nitrite reductase/ring-hydroxylating ferredoxin subunit